jgi:uncharacterized protein
MSLNERITNDLTQAMKAADALSRDTLRAAKTAIKNSEITKGHALSEEEIIDVLAKEVKQRQDSIQSFTTGNRPELAQKEQAEINVIKQYLPEQLSEDEIRSLVTAAVSQTGATEAKDMGKVMAILMPQVRGKADGGLVSRIVKESLGA